jgi:mono/diheme cytochrome c family protein
MNAKKIAVFVVILAALAGVIYFVIWFSNHGFSARENPSWVETVVARQARKTATPAGAKELKNPQPVTEASTAEAREHFVEHCSVCHGSTGRGDTLYGRNLYPKVPDLTQADTQQLTDGELFYIISNGVRFTGMPAFGGEDSSESIWWLVSFIRRLPKLNPDEIKQLQRMAEGGKSEMDEKSAAPEPTGSKEKRTPNPHSHGPGSKPHVH